MGFTYRQGQEERLSIAQMDNNFLYAEEQISSLTASVVSLEQSIDNINNVIAGITASEALQDATVIAGLTASVITLNTNLASATASIATLNTNVASATASIVTLETNLASATASISALESDVIELQNIPVLTTYPVTTPSSAGTHFWYKGNEWHYMTDDEINSTGWTGSVSLGFPAPISKKIDKFLYFSEGTFTTNGDGQLSLTATSSYIDFIGLGRPDKVSIILADSSKTSFMPYAITILGFRNAALLSSLEDSGTILALVFVNTGLTAEIIDDLFTQLPATNKTATINVSSGNPGSGTCDTTIATNKGYTVIV